MANPNIQEIHPLSFMQQALLLHHISEKDDQGLLYVNCQLSGEMDLDIFQRSWNLFIKNEPVLRTTIHWENLSKPIQVVHRECDIKIDYLDWTAIKDEEFQRKLDEINQQELRAGINLGNAPVMRLSLIKISAFKYQLIWICHHILLDGWSSYLVLEQILKYYDQLHRGTVPHVVKSSNYFNYLKWCKEIDKSQAESFWKNNLKGLELPTLISNSPNSESTDSEFASCERTIPGKDLQGMAKELHISLNVLYQGLWGIIISKYLDRKDIVIGITVSGRNVPNYPEAEGIIGMLMNVIPLRINLSKYKNQSLADFLKTIQKSILDLTRYETLGLNEILYYKNWSSNLALFDSLFVFENFVNKRQESKQVLESSNYSSGITTTYPATLTILPGDQTSISIKYNRSKIEDLVAEEMINNLEKLCRIVAEAKSSSVDMLLNKVNFSSLHPEALTELKLDNTQDATHYEKLLIYNRNIEGTSIHQLNKRPEMVGQYVPPESMLQLKLTQLWEDVFGWYPIGIQDNFFDIGGTSMMAVQLFSQIDQNLAISLPPTTLLEAPNIESISQQIDKKGEDERWAVLVPLRSTGSKRPLFCLHAGGAHVLFYHDLAKNLSTEQPVYAIQPLGLEGKMESHKSIREMASYYIGEIRKVQPNGPYAILGTCFSDAVALEMANQLKTINETVDPLIIVDSEPFGMDLTKSSTKEKLFRYFNLAKDGKFHLLKEIVKGRINKLRNIQPFFEGYKKYEGIKQEQLKNLEQFRNDLSNLYLDYQWEEYDGDVTFVQCQEYSERPWRHKVIETWKQVIKGNIDVQVVPGHHLTLFEEPEVKGLANQVQKCVDNYVGREKVNEATV